MQPLTRTDLMPLETYAVERVAFRARVLAHKQARRVALGEHVTLLFEDRLTVQYQIQEMLRIERLFEPAAIQAELDAYNPLVPGGRDLRATMLIEYPDAVQRHAALATLGGIEHRVFAEVDGLGRASTHADEDLGRSDGARTAAVHFLRVAFAPAPAWPWASTMRACRCGSTCRRRRMRRCCAISTEPIAVSATLPAHALHDRISPCSAGS
jgi:hypothetical protein